jgi:hypothetical protein
MQPLQSNNVPWLFDDFDSFRPFLLVRSQPRNAAAQFLNSD